MIDYLRCIDVDYQSERVDKFLDFALAIIPFGSTEALCSLSECIDAYVRPEILDGDNKYYAECVGKKVTAIKGLKFGKLPQIMSVQLKRFVYDFSGNSMVQKKVNDKVSFPMLLDMNRYVPKKSKTITKSKVKCEKMVSGTDTIDPYVTNVDAEEEEDEEIEEVEDEGEFELYLREQTAILRKQLEDFKKKETDKENKENLKSIIDHKADEKTNVNDILNVDPLLPRVFSASFTTSSPHSNFSSVSAGVSTECNIVSNISDIDIDNDMDTDTDGGFIGSHTAISRAVSSTNGSGSGSGSNTEHKQPSKIGPFSSPIVAAVSASAVISVTASPIAIATATAAVVAQPIEDYNCYDMNDDNHECYDNIEKNDSNSIRTAQEESESVYVTISADGYDLFNCDEQTDSTVGDVGVRAALVSTCTAPSGSTDLKVPVSTYAPVTSIPTDALHWEGNEESSRIGDVEVQHEVELEVDKDLSHRHMPSEVDVDKVIKRRGEYVYELYAVLNHSGAISGGHYYAYIKNLESKKWYNFNDSNVSEISEEKVCEAWGGTAKYNGTEIHHQLFSIIFVTYMTSGYVQFK